MAAGLTITISGNHLGQPLQMAQFYLPDMVLSRDDTFSQALFVISRTPGRLGDHARHGALVAPGSPFGRAQRGLHGPLG